MLLEEALKELEKLRDQNKQNSSTSNLWETLNLTRVLTSPVLGAVNLISLNDF